VTPPDLGLPPERLPEAPAPVDDVADAIGRLPGLDEAARHRQRQHLEGLTQQLFAGSADPPEAPRSWPQWAGVVLLVAGALIAAVAMARRPAAPKDPAGATLVPPAHTARADGGPRQPAPRGALVPDSAAGTAVPESPALAGSVQPAPAATALAGRPVADARPAAGILGPSPGRLPPGSAAATGAASGGVAGMATPGSTKAAMLPVPLRCPIAGLPTVQAGGGPWLTGKVLNDACRPVGGVVLAFEAAGSGIQFLARSEPDGSYAVALEPGHYSADVVGEDGWWPAAPGPGGALEQVAPSLAIDEATDVRRMDFILQGGGR
jgi:hypothetical protein